MSASFRDVVLWVMPILFGGFVSLCGLLTLLLGRFDPGSGWEVRGAAAVFPGVLALPSLPLISLINPSLSQRATWTADCCTRHGGFFRVRRLLGCGVRRRGHL